MADEASDDEAAWRDLVAQYSIPTAAEGGPPWPAREDPDAAQAPAQEWADPVPGVTPAPPQARIIRPAVPAPLPSAGDDEHYVPPDPPPPSRRRPGALGEAGGARAPRVRPGRGQLSRPRAPGRAPGHAILDPPRGGAEQKSPNAGPPPADDEAARIEDGRQIGQSLTQ